MSGLGVVDRVASQLRRAIVCGQLGPSQEFSLRQIAGRLGVSFVSVREALLLLEAEGLLVAHRGRRVVVAPFDGAELGGLCRLRRLIEPDLCVRATRLMGSAELDRVESAVVSTNPCMVSLDCALEANISFRRGLLRPATTRWDGQVLDGLWLGVSRYLYVGLPRLTSEQAGPYQLDVAQRELIAAFRTRDPLVTRVAWEAQLARDEIVAQLAIGKVS
jgi:DNA-binding GntR family transcriptional regulator